MSAFLLVVGLALLLGGGTAMVKGASGLATSIGVPPLVVGLTVVAFGTSAPELVVNLAGVLRGETALAFGNIAGSNLANIGLVLALAAIIKPVRIEGRIVARELPLLLLGMMMLVVMSLDPLLRASPAFIDRADAIVLLGLFAIFLYITVSDYLAPAGDPLIASVDAHTPTTGGRGLIDLWFLVGGSMGLAAGGHLTVTAAISLAEAWHAPTVFIGIAVVGVGTSLPELVTSIIATVRKEADLCVGNIIGSNLFNGLFVLPISALVLPLPVPRSGSIDLFVAFIFAAALIPVFVFGKTVLGRGAAGMMLLVYFVYVAARGTLLA